MKFVKRNGGSSSSLVERICERRNTTEKIMLSSDEKSLNDPRKLDNIEEAAIVFLNHLHSNSKIYVQVDSDVDGYTSSAILYNYVYLYQKEFLKNFYFEIHEGKQHGLFPEKISEEYKLVIAPDASSNEYREHKTLKERGHDILVLDHHECDMYSEHAIVVNNQLSKDYPNKALCGAGVVFQFCRELDYQLGLNFSEELMDLVAVGLAADMMNVTNPETRYLLDEGLKAKNINSLLVKRIADNNMKINLTSQDISFSVAPLVNATIRVSDAELKRRVFESLLIDKQGSMVVSNKRGVFGNQTEELTTQVLRNMNTAKSQQKRLVEKLVASIKENNDLTVKPIVALIEPDVNPTLIGLVANMLSNEYQCPVVILRENENAYTGSLRAYGVDDFRTQLETLSSVTYAQGHESAAGVAVTCLETFRKEIAEKFSDFTFEEKMEWDEEHLCNQLPSKPELLAVARLSEKVGQGFSKPIFKITGLNLNSQNSKICGARNNVIRVESDSFAFVKMYTNKNYLEELYTPEHAVSTTLYCSVVANEYEDRVSPQFRIEAYEHDYDFMNYLF